MATKAHEASVVSRVRTTQNVLLASPPVSVSRPPVCEGTPGCKSPVVDGPCPPTDPGRRFMTWGRVGTGGETPVTSSDILQNYRGD